MAIVRTTALLEGGSDFAKGVTPFEVALITFAARGRRLLYSAYRLLDVGEESEASPLLRVIHEYVIVTRWLLGNEGPRTAGWTLNDMGSRAAAAEKTAEDKQLDDATRKNLRALAKETRDKRDQAAERIVGDVEELPKGGLEQMAIEAGLRFPYSFAYRLQSQSDVHATALAIDKTLDRLDDGTLRLKERPEPGLSEFDSYQIGAHLLLDLVRPLADRWPDLGWTDNLDAVTSTLTGIARADPASTASPPMGASAAEEDAQRLEDETSNA